MKKITITIISVLCLSISLFGQTGLLITDLEDEESQNDWLEKSWGSGGRFIARALSSDTPDDSEYAIQIDIDYTAGGWGAAWGNWTASGIGPDTAEVSVDASGYNYFSCYLKSTIPGASLDVWFEHFPGTGDIEPGGYVNIVTISDIGDEWDYYEVSIAADDMTHIRDGIHDMTEVNRMSFGGPLDLGETYSILMDQLYFIMEPGDGIYTPPSLIDNNDLEPGQFNLVNYPNPFNQSTTIKYNLKSPGTVVFKIHTVSGQEVETLVNGFQIAGEYEAIWDPGDLPAGIYYYSIWAGEYSQTKKLLLQR